MSILIPKIRTKRIAVQPKELTIGQSISICRMSPDRPAACETALLNFVCADAQMPSNEHVQDPLLWTVEERTFAVTRYLSAVSPEADFAMGEGRLSDYVRFDRDISARRVDLGVVAGRGRAVVPALGVHAEVLERVCSGLGEWMRGLMACQLVDSDEAPADLMGMTEVEQIEWLRSRMAALGDLPESEFEELFHAWSEGRTQIEHFFRLIVDGDGLCFAPQEGSAAKAQARFRADACVSPTARLMSR